jgi:hypothetical protein
MKAHAGPAVRVGVPGAARNTVTLVQPAALSQAER